MPLEIDDQSIRIIGNNFKGLKFYDDLRALQQEIYLKSDNTLNIGGSGGGGGGSGGMEAHAIDGVLHVGTLADVQGPQFLLLDGTRAMAGALDMGAFAITNVGNVDGVDVSAFKIAYDAHVLDANAHHNVVTLDSNADTILSLSTQQLGLDTQVANRVWAGPTSGAAAVPAFRAMVGADLSGILTTRGDVLTRNSTQPDRLALGAAAEFLGSDGTDAVYLGAQPANGFVNRTDSAFSMSGSTFQITVPGAGYVIYSAGKRYTKTTTQTVSIASDLTQHHVYFDTAGTLQVLTGSAWSITSDNVPAATVYRDDAAYAIADERHSYRRDRWWHQWAHDTIGARYESGLAGTFADTTFSIAQGIIHDEDVEHDTGGTLTTCRLWYRNSAGSAMRFESAIARPWKLGATPAPQYDTGSGLADVTANRYFCSYVYATNDIDYKIYIVVGQAEHVTLAAARNDSLPALPGQLTREWKLLYRLIYQRNGASATYIEATDFREVTTGPGSSYTPASHPNLTNRDAANSHPASAIREATTLGRLMQGNASTGDLEASTLIKSGAGVLTLSAAGAYTATIQNTGTVALGAGSNTVSSTNDVTGANHTHAVTTSSNPGAAAAILASTAAGYLQLVRLGVGVAPSYPLHALSTTEQLRLAYDVSNYASFTVGSGGNLTLAPTGDLILDPTGNDVLPNTNYDINLGALSKKYLTLHCAELWVETLVAQDTIATIGGRILVGPTTVLTSDLAAGDTTIYVKHNQMASGDRVYLEADGKVEFMAITGAPGGAGPYSYTVTRNLDGSGANQWYAGDAVFNTGTTGDGFIDLYSVRGVKSATQYGPTIVGNVRNSATYNDWTECWAIGNLNGLYGYGVDTYGVGLGKYSAADYMTIDPTNGIRFLDSADVVQAQLSASVWTLGRVAASFSNVQITAGAIKLRTNTTDHVELTTAGTFWAGDTSSTERIQWDTTNGLRIYDANNAAVFSSSPAGVTWLSTLAISDNLGQSLFSAADGLLLLGPGGAITPTSWTSTRGQAATLSGAFHRVAGRWAESKALVVEVGATNLCTNPSFETGTTGWSTAGTTLTQSTSFSVVGAYSGKLVATGVDSYIYGDFVTNPPAGNSYTLSGWVIGDATTIGKTMRFTLREQGGATGAQDTSLDVVLTGIWQKFTVTRTIVQADRTALRAIISRNTVSTVGDTRYVDGVQLEATAYATTYCDGSLGTGYSWSGTAHASTSTRTVTEVNLDTTAGIVSGLNSLSIATWVQAPYAATPGGWSTGYPRVFSAYYDGSNYITLLYNATTTGYFYLSVNGSSLATGAAAAAFSAGDWLHVVATLDFTNDRYAVYVNGARTIYTTATALTAPTGLNQMNVGSEYNATSLWGGAIAEVALFNAVLTAEEVAGLYAAGRPLADMGAIKRPGIYILDGEFDIRSSQTGARVQIDVNGVAGYSAATTQTFSLQTDGDLFLGSNISAAATTALAVFATAQTYNSESLGEGDLLIGDNSANKANILWDKSAGKLQFRGGTTMQVEIGTDGKLYAGGGAVALDSGGVSIAVTTAFGETNSYKFKNGSDVVITLDGYTDTSTFNNASRWWVYPITNCNSDIDVLSESPTGKIASASFYAKSGSNSGGIAIYAYDTDSKYYVNLVSQVFVNDTANAKNTYGLTINQLTADDEALAIKSSDVAHGITDIAETDTYGLGQKVSATEGGLHIAGLTETTKALSLTGHGVTDNTTKSTSGIGYVEIVADKKSGTSVGACGTDANLLVIRNYTTTRFIFDAEGSAHADVEWTTFDAHNDVALLETLEQTLLARDFGNWLDSNHAQLERLNLAHFDEKPGHAVVNFTRLSMLLVGAIRQLSARLDIQERVLATGEKL